MAAVNTLNVDIRPYCFDRQRNKERGSSAPCLFTTASHAFALTSSQQMQQAVGPDLLSAWQGDSS
jgi:hypothetical protein